MYKNDKKNIALTALLFVCFIVFTALVSTVDVAAIGPQGSSVGFAKVNQAVSEVFPYSDPFYLISKYLGYLALLICAAFGVLGVAQLISRKSLRKVDPELVLLGAFYVAVIIFYVMFMVVVVNYRPVLEDGALESSYPSSHTMLAVCAFVSASMYIARTGLSDGIKKAIKIAMIVLTVAMVYTRMASGVHWFTDIVGGVLLSAALLMMYKAAVSHVTQARLAAAEAPAEPDVPAADPVDEAPVEEDAAKEEAPAADDAQEDKPAADGAEGSGEAV